MAGSEMVRKWFNSLLSTKLPLPEPGRMPPAPLLSWRRKSDQEIRHDARWEEWRWRIHPLPPLLIGAAIAAVVQCARMPNVKRGHRGIPLEQAVKEFPLVFLICFALVYLFQLVLKPRPHVTPKRVNICTRCHDVAPNTGRERCDCGGELEDADLWTHEPEPPPPSPVVHPLRYWAQKDADPSATSSRPRTGRDGHAETLDARTPDA